MKRYVFQIIVEEGNDEFWEGVEQNPGQGIEDLHVMIKECLATTGLDDSEVRLIEYTDKE
jgi:hypothetical protein